MTYQLNNSLKPPKTAPPAPASGRAASIFYAYFECDRFACHVFGFYIRIRNRF